MDSVSSPEQAFLVSGHRDLEKQSELNETDLQSTISRRSQSWSTEARSVREPPRVMCLSCKERQLLPTANHDEDNKEQTNRIAAEIQPLQQLLEQCGGLGSDKQMQYSHQKRSKAHRELLASVLSDDRTNSGHIFVCWDTGDSCQVLPVSVSDSADELAIWNEVHKLYYSYRGWWRKHLPLIRVRHIDVVKVLIIGLSGVDETRQECGGTRIYTAVHRTETVQIQREQLRKIVHDYQPQENPCAYDPVQERTVCDIFSCVSCFNSESEVPCPEEQLYSARDKLRNLDNRPIMSLAFNGRGYAGLMKLAEREGLFYSDQDILRIVEPLFNHSFEPYFNALRIQESLVFNLHDIAVPIFATFVVIVIGVSRLAWGDWSTTWSAAGAIATLAGLYLSWATYLTRTESK